MICPGKSVPGVFHPSAEGYFVDAAMPTGPRAASAKPTVGRDRAAAAQERGRRDRMLNEVNPTTH